MSATAVCDLMGAIADVGRDPVRGGYSRFVHTTADRELREWFGAEAARRSLDVEVDRNGNLWAWRPDAAGTLTGAVVTGSHLDSVPGGGAWDGPLGVASAFAAVDELDRRGVTGRQRPLAVAAFAEEEGSRFGVACLGSRLMTGALDPERARSLRDAEGVTFAEACARAGTDPRHIGPDPELLDRIGCYVELHLEQGRGLVDHDQPVAIGTAILGHGRWRITVAGEGNHAGTTRMSDRRDPMIVAAGIVLLVQQIARRDPQTRATVGRLVPVPGGTNVIASRVDLWLDVRHFDDSVTAGVVAAVTHGSTDLAQASGCSVQVAEESLTGTTFFDYGLNSALRSALPAAPLLDTGAGHDAGVLSAHLPSAMLFVRNPTGVSHSPAEEISDADAEAGAVALADTLERLLVRAPGEW